MLLLGIFATLNFNPLQPTTEESKAKLVEEIKNRAKSCISSRNYPEAIALYSKAISVSTDNGQTAILYANRSMCQLNMSKTTEAINDASEAIQLDPNYVKSYYRLAMAHVQSNSYAQAKEALERGLALKPDDKELLQQLQRINERLSSSSSSTASVPRAANKVSVSHSTASKSVSSSSVPAPSSSSSAKDNSKPNAGSSTVVVDDEEDAELKGGELRGYKKTSDGRTTTFFNREIDENTKALIGNIAPKKLEAQGEVITTGVATGSAWNAAGTYEEKNLTSWVTEYLTSRFSSLSTVIEDAQIDGSVKQAAADVASILIETTAASNVGGHAQLTLARGKTKHVCDFSMTLKWSLLVTYHDNSKSPNKASGELAVIDITADRDYEIDNIQVTHLNDTTSSASALPRELSQAVNKYVKNGSLGLQKLIVQNLEVFWNELKAKV